MVLLKFFGVLYKKEKNILYLLFEIIIFIVINVEGWYMKYCFGKYILIWWEVKLLDIIFKI